MAYPFICFYRYGIPTEISMSDIQDLANFLDIADEVVVTAERNLHCKDPHVLAYYTTRLNVLDQALCRMLVTYFTEKSDTTSTTEVC